MNEITLKVIDIIKNSPQCMDSVRQVPCDDYEFRFGAFIRVRHGILLMNLIDWATVSQTINSAL